MNKIELNLKEVRFINFFDYFALEQNLTNNYNFSSYYEILKFINKDKNIKKFSNLNNNFKLLDLINDYYNKNAKIKLYYNKLDLLVSINNGQFYYDFLININNFIFINYFDILEFIGELEEYIKELKN